MNIYRQKYGIVKNKLYAFGKKLGMGKSKIYMREFWAEKFALLIDENTWDYVITSYLTFCCNREELRFINALFFEKEPVIGICADLHLSEKTVYAWREQILLDILGLAMQSGLIYIDITRENNCKSTNALIEITEDHIAKVIEMLGYRVGKISELERVLQAIVWVEQNGCAWKNLPSEYGSWRVVYNIYNRWSRSGKLEMIKEVIYE